MTLHSSVVSKMDELTSLALNFRHSHQFPHPNDHFNLRCLSGKVNKREITHIPANEMNTNFNLIFILAFNFEF